MKTTKPSGSGIKHMLRKTLIVMVSLLMTGTSAFAQNANWMISEASGTVLVKTVTATVPARKGGQVPPGAVVSTAGNSRAVLVHGKDFVTVNANGRVRIPAPGDEGYGLFDVLQEWGNALFQIEKQPKPHFTVRTRYLAAVVKGTTFSITVSDQGASLQVVEGAVETSTADGGARELITPGVVAMVEAADRMRLTVQDQQTKTIDSPARTETPVRGSSSSSSTAPTGQASEPAASVSSSQQEPAARAEPLTETSIAPMASPSAASISESEPQVLTEAITASPTNLGAVTDGFVSGTVVAQLASADVKGARSDLGSSNAGGNGNGASNGNSGSIASNSGGGSSGNAGNSSGSSNAGGNGNGAGNGNSGSSASNSGSGSSGNAGNSSGSSNAGGNGNSASNGNAASSVGSNSSGNNGNNSTDSKSDHDSSSANDNKPDKSSGSDDSKSGQNGSNSNDSKPDKSGGNSGAGGRTSLGLGIGVSPGGPKLGLDLSADTAKPGGRGTGGRGN